MAEAPGLGSQTVEYSALVRKVVETSVSGLKELCETSPELSDTEKKIGLLKYIVKTRLRLLRLVALTKWCRQVPLVEQCQQLAGTLSNHDMSFTQAADFLFYLHETLLQARAPIYDVPAASEILVTGNYNGLPKCVDDLEMQPVLVGEDREAAVNKLNAILRTRLLDILLPKQITDIKVTGGRVILKVDGEFEVHLTLGYRGHLSFWRVLKLDILVGEPSDLIQFTDPQAYFLGDELERRMAASEDPLGLMYSILNQFCTALVMDTLFRQINALQGGKWRDTIKYEKLADSGLGNATGMGQAIAGQGIGHVGNMDLEPGSARKTRGSPGLKVVYWLERQKGEASASLRIEQGLADQQITCSHSPAVIDPSTGSEAEFVIDSGCINVEKLLLRAITCSIHTRLLEVQRGLQGCVRLWQSDNDVVLRCSIPSELESSSETTTGGEDVEKSGEEVLCVRAFGVSYMVLGISIRNGRFLLRCPSTVLAASTIKNMEDELNLATVQPLDVFVNLRTKCLLHYFGLIGMSLNLKLYERGTSAVKFPLGGPKIGGDVLLMGFPHCEDCFFLCVQFDSNFTPLFTLLEAQPPTSLSGRTTLLSSTFDIFRWMKIDIEAGPIPRGNKVSYPVMQTGYEDNIISASTAVKLTEDEECDKFAVSPLIRGLGRAGGLGLDGILTGLETYYGVDNGGSGASYRGSMLAVQSLSHLQGVSRLHHGSSPLQHGSLGHDVNGSSGLTNPSIIPTGYQGKSLGSPTFGDGNHRLGWHSTLNGASSHNIPGVSPLQACTDTGNQILNRKAPLRNASDQEVAHMRSPLAMGDNAASPIELDHEHISKLIDSISSKTPGSFTTTDSCSRHGRHIPQSRNGTAPLNSRPVLGNIGSPSGSQFGRFSGLAQVNSPGWNSMVSPCVPFNADLGSSFQEWTDLEHGRRLGGGSEKWPKWRRKRKRFIADLYNSLSSLQSVPMSGERKKRRTGLEVVSVAAFQPKTNVPSTSAAVSVSVLSQSYCYAIQAANQWKAPAGAYRAVFQQVEERCRLCIKHSRLTRQMDAQRIPYVNEVGLQEPCSVLRFRLPATVPTGDSRIRLVGIDDSSGWQQMSLYLGNPGSEGWDVKVLDTYISGLWELQKQCEGSPYTGEQFTSSSQDDSHMQCTHEGLVLKYLTVQGDSITKLVTDLERIWRARTFSIGICRLLRSEDDETNQGNEQRGVGQSRPGNVGDKAEVGMKKWEVMRQAFRVEAVGLTSVSFTYVGSMPGIVARFVVEWGTTRRGCTVHSPEQLWPHTKFLEDYINGGEVELLLDAIQVTAGPLHALAAAIRPARMAVPSSGSFHPPSSPSPASALVAKCGGPGGSVLNLYGLAGTGINPVAGQGQGSNGGPPSATYGNMTINNGVAGTSQGGLPSNTGRSPGPGLVPSSLLPTDVSVLLRSAYWVRIVYRREFAIDMRCFAGDQVWLQPAPRPRNGGKGSGGSLACPQFRTFVVEHVTLGMNSADSVGGGAAGPPLATGSNSLNTGACSGPRQTGAPANRPGNSIGSNSVGVQGGSVVSVALRIPAAGSGLGSSIPIRGELNPALVGMGDDGGFGGAWVPLAALKKVLRGTLRYLGGLWLFAQFPNILKEVLASTLNTTEAALLNHDPEQPALRFFIRGCVFAVNMHRQQLFLQAINVKRYQQQQALSAVHQAPGQAVNLASELSLQEMQDIGDFFARRVASEPYDASRLASFVTMLTLPVPVLREFLMLIQWKKEASKTIGAHGTGRDASTQGVPPRPRVELSLESPVGRGRREHVIGRQDESDVAGGLQGSSSIQHNQHRNTVEFTLTFSFDASQVPHLNVAGGAGWLPQSVALRLVCLYGESSNRISLMNIDVSHDGRSCWARLEDWEQCKERVAQAVEGGSVEGQGRLRMLAEAVQVTLQSALMQIGENNFQSQQYGA